MQQRDLKAVKETLASRLKSARRATGMSTRKAALKLSKVSAISHTSIANYERGIGTPTLEVLSLLAQLYQRPINWFLEPGPRLTGVRYRNLKSKVGVTDRHRYEAVAERWLDGYVRLERRLKRPLKQKIRMPEIDADSDGASAASLFRHHIGLADSEPVPSLVRLLEGLGVRVMELQTDLAIDAMAARLGSEHVVVLNPECSNDRTRLNAAHELAHIIFNDCDDVPDENHEHNEKRAYQFASHLLLTGKMLKEAFHGRSMVRLVKYKRQFGISLAAMVYRAEEDEIISKKMAKRLWVEFSRRGWRRHEPGEVRPDPATRFEELIDSGIVNGQLDWSEAAQVTGIREDELRKRVRLAEGTITWETEKQKGGASAAPVFRIVE